MNNKNDVNNMDVPWATDWRLVIVALVVVFTLGLLSGAVIVWLRWVRGGPEAVNATATNSTNEFILYVVSWAILLLISIGATREVGEALRSCADDRRRRAYVIAVVIGLVMMLFLFKQSYLEELLRGQDTNTFTKIMLFGGATISGWFVWYLRELETYGEFFYVLLMTIITGFCWYARLTAPEEVQYTAVAFLLGSLFRIAKGYMDAQPVPGEVGVRPST